MNHKNSLINKITNNNEVIGIIGLGYVGLPLAVAFAQEGINVIGFEKNKKKVELINNGENYIKDIDDSYIKDLVIKKKNFFATINFSKIKECDVLIICVPTPLDKFRKPDMHYIEEACTEIGQNMKSGTFISLESTTYPTTTEDLMLPIIEKVSGMIHGIDFWLAYSPERVDPGNQNFHTKNTPKVLGSLNDDGLEIGIKIYSKAIDQIHPVSSPRVAEMVKILENTYRLVNISLINELALLAGKMNINIWEVIEAANTKPFGFQAFYPGPGIGGHCIPLDPFYLEHIAKKFDFDLSLIHTAGHINMRMPHYMYIKIAAALNKEKKSINGCKILFLGIAYKPNIDDARESPVIEIMKILEKKGGIIYYHDPYIPKVLLDSNTIKESVSLTDNQLKEADAVVIGTNHSIFDEKLILSSSKLIIDLRNMIKVQDSKVHKL